MHRYEALTPQIGRILATHRPAQGENSDVTMVTAERGDFVLKQATNDAQIRTVADEAIILAAIGSEYPFVPRLVTSGPDYLLMTRLPGRDLVDCQAEQSPADLHRILTEAAAAIRRVHTWRPALPPVPDALRALCREHGVEPDGSFAHNDYCLPNIMIDGGHVSAIIDWPHAGHSDHRLDLAAAVRSIRRNLKDEAYVQTFLQAYGFDGDLAPWERIWQAL